MKRTILLNKVYLTIALTTTIVLSGLVMMSPNASAATSSITTGQTVVITTSTPDTTGTVATTPTPVATPSLTPTPTPRPSLTSLEKGYCGKTKWKKVNKAGRKLWDKVARETMHRMGIKSKDIKEAMWIHHHEGGPNSVNPSGCYGGWQLSSGMAHGHKWWCPVWETKRAVKYMRGRYGSIHKAYLFKKSHDWY